MLKKQIISENERECQWTLVSNICLIQAGAWHRKNLSKLLPIIVADLTMNDDALITYWCCRITKVQKKVYRCGLWSRVGDNVFLFISEIK